MYKKDSYNVSNHYRFGVEHPYLIELRKAWGDKLRQAFTEMPRFSEQ
jgi:putative proteasome-type protease